MTLTELGLKYKTDKALYHNFTPIYDEVLSPIKNNKINFLEIGVLLGCSLKMWEEYFPNAKIYGADILSEKEIIDNQQKQSDDFYKNIIFDKNKTKLIHLNQEKKEDLLSLSDDWDIIVEDGGHTMIQQQLTLNILFHKLKPNGIYILEDLHTSYYSEYGATNQNNTINLLRDLKNKTLSPDNQYYIDKNDFENLLNIINTIEIYTVNQNSITSIITKK